MSPEFIREHLKLPPEQVRLRLMYPDLPDPIPFATADAGASYDDENDEDDEDARDEEDRYVVSFEYAPRCWRYGYVVTADHYRIIRQYQKARYRQEDAEEACAAARWNKAEVEAEAQERGAREPDPEEIPPAGKLTQRQELFCEHYAAQPVGTRAAALAGYSEENAPYYGSRLLKNPLILDRIARLRAAQRIEYVVERDTVHDKLEAVFFEAIGERNHAAAVAALRLQANLAGMLTRAAPSAAEIAARKAKESQGAAAKKPRKAKVGSPKKPRKAKVPRPPRLEAHIGLADLVVGEQLLAGALQRDAAVLEHVGVLRER
jgi:hypothetical protein